MQLFPEDSFDFWQQASCHVAHSSGSAPSSVDAWRRLAPGRSMSGRAGQLELPTVLPVPEVKLMSPGQRLVQPGLQSLGALRLEGALTGRAVGWELQTATYESGNEQIHRFVLTAISRS